MPIPGTKAVSSDYCEWVGEGCCLFLVHVPTIVSSVLPTLPLRFFHLSHGWKGVRDGQRIVLQGRDGQHAQASLNKDLGHFPLVCKRTCSR